MKRTLLNYIFLPALLGVSTAAMAADDTRLILTLSDNTTVQCTFSQQPVMTFSDTTLSLSTADSQVGQWLFSDVASWRFEAVEETAIQGALQDAAIRISEGQIAVQSAKPVALYDTAGRKVAAPVSQQGTLQTLSTSSLPAGIYLLKAGNAAFKFCVK